jgi:hypothetical protein
LFHTFIHGKIDFPLKDHRVQRLCRVVGDDCRASGVGGFEPGEDAQQCRLATARRPDDRAEAAARNIERDAVERHERARARREALAEAGDPDLGRQLDRRFGQGHHPSNQLTRHSRERAGLSGE